jgi:hypothetical protein
VHKLPTLGTDLDFPNWRLRLIAALDGLGLLPMLDDEKFMPHRWPRLKTWILQSLNTADWHVGFHTKSLKQIVEALKYVHSSRDSTNAKQIIADIFDLKPEQGESAQSVITRVKTLNSTLESLNRGLPEELLVTAIQKALKKVPAYEAIVNILETVGTDITMQTLMEAFAAKVTPAIPGAMMASAEMDQIKEAMANMAKKYQDVNSKLNDPNFMGKRRHDGHSGRGPSRSHYDPALKTFVPGGRGRGHGRGGRGGRTGGRGTFKCLNCGIPGHKADDCRFPCGGCKSTSHKFPTCKYNPMSQNFVPVNQRQPLVGNSNTTLRSRVRSTNRRPNPRLTMWTLLYLEMQMMMGKPSWLANIVSFFPYHMIMLCSHLVLHLLRMANLTHLKHKCLWHKALFALVWLLMLIA